MNDKLFLHQLKRLHRILTDHIDTLEATLNTDHPEWGARRWRIIQTLSFMLRFASRPASPPPQRPKRKAKA